MTVKMPNSTYGIWRVTTEGDCEGRSVRNLGIHEGYIDEIAELLSGNCYYSLNFELFDAKHNVAPLKPPADFVHINLSAETETWGLTASERVPVFSKWFKTQ